MLRILTRLVLVASLAFVPRHGVRISPPRGVERAPLFSPPPAARPRFRRHQFGGVAGGPLQRDRTFFFVDYQGQQQDIDRTVISTVPTLLQRQGVFTEAISDRVPLIFDPGTTVPDGKGGFVRTPFRNGRIPLDRMDPAAVALLHRYPEPTSAGTANNYRRTAPEINDQNQCAVRIDHRFSSTDSLFGRLTNVRDRFLPVWSPFTHVNVSAIWLTLVRKSDAVFMGDPSC